MVMHRCKTCCETDSRPTTEFDKNGIYLPCKNVSLEASKHINWDERKQILKEIVKSAKKRTKNGAYDCIIGVSGGKKFQNFCLF